MPLRRRNTLPPFEVMRQASARYGASSASSTRPAATPAAPASPPPPVVMSRAPLERPAASGGTGWWARAQEPVRVPRVICLGVALAFVVMMFVAYWAGKDVGRRSGQSAQQDMELASDQRLARPAQVPPPQGETAFNGTDARQGEASSLRPAPGYYAPGKFQGMSAAGTSGSTYTPPPRQKGLNYMVLASFPKEKMAEAQRLVQFLVTYRVDAGVFWGHNGRSLQVLALHGFTRSQLGNPEFEKYENTLLELGRVWRNKYKGETNFLDMYLELYSGDAATHGTPPTGSTR